MLKSYACLPENSKGRIYPEKPTPYRNEFERDRDRIIHANAFKRLQYKTQVFVNHEGDHYRNRMTHSVEVSTIARSLAKALGLNDDLSEAVALAHDLGHTPFGHAGEDALNDCMKDFGGFSHNAHSFKILTYLEKKYAAYDGLNLTWEVLEGIVKHNGPVDMKESYAYIFEYDSKNSLDLARHSSAEAQVAALSDDIAYICHDLEDSIRAEIVTYKDLQEIEFVDKYIHEVKNTYQDVNDSRLIYEVGRKLTHHLIESLLFQTRVNIEKHKIKTEADIRGLGKQLVEFTNATCNEVKLIKDFLMKKVYKHHRVVSVTLQCQTVVRDLFKLYVQNIELLPFSWRQMIEDSSEDTKMATIADYIAGMTDRFAIKQYQAFYNLNFASTDL
ncbi:MAG: deoxyguanosinetriphosphate triphosphohydrolase [Rickettsiaceae bacterium]